ncbi:hypothetical protein DUNSADRAFT_11299 [Dunaliella salina]|uniref:G8 domain-containing protein n=1 Tax=Dunaliella salina TaxID=3046 RepID=A0ABQ7GDM7_DUNSA|nr:hypothetical protein DUNSADRAFT_11299 [Dunaliella salina]|eukprot:KAF5832717.1 hypothetical protein DUNSADRAFT_11299 [Dunaliella salina]
MLNSHQPSQLKFVPVLVTDQETNKTSRVFFTHYNDDGYQFVVPTQRDYWLHWEVLAGSTLVKVDPTQIRIHRPDLLDDSSWVYITTSNIQLQNHYVVNGKTTIAMNYTGLPDPMDENTMHGDAYYNKTFVPDTWNYGDNQYNHTLFTMVALGPNNGALQANPRFCPPDGCTNEPEEVVDKREGILLWSEPETWSDGTQFPNGKPIAGENVTIPFGWNLIIDEDPAPLEVLDIQGNVTFSRTQDITLQAKCIQLTRNGYLLVWKMLIDFL